MQTDKFSRRIYDVIIIKEDDKYYVECGIFRTYGCEGTGYVENNKLRFYSDTYYKRLDEFNIRL